MKVGIIAHLVFIVSVLEVGVLNAASPNGICPIGRTLEALEKSTADRPATVRILFYGQSIVGLGWHTNVIRRLQKRYPTARLEVENRAIGGFTSPDLARTAESDLYPHYPDLLFFHVYGPLDRYESVIRKVCETTTAEIVLWSSHLDRNESVNIEAVARALKSHPDRRSSGIREIAERYGCLYVDLRKKWCEALLHNGWVADMLLQDGIHLSKSGPAFALYADILADVIDQCADKAQDPVLHGTIEEVAVSDHRVAKSGDGGLTLDFCGNRVVAVSDGAGIGDFEILLDGRSPANFPEMYYTTRPSKLVSWMPMIKHVDIERGAQPVEEDWTLTYLVGTQPSGNPIKYKVVGSVTGFDGEGWSTNDFRSTSGRALIAKADFHTWQYGRFVTDESDEKNSRPGQQITWSTRGLFTDHYEACLPVKSRTTLVQGCDNCKHRLQLVPKGECVPGISHFIIYSPQRHESVKVKVGKNETLKTLIDARDAVRKIKASTGGSVPDGGIIVELDDGEYVLEEALILDARDSGREGAAVRWRARNRGCVRISGAKKVRGWRKWQNDIFVADIPFAGELPDFHGGSEEMYASRLNFPLWLYQGGARLDCARFPNRPKSVSAYDDGYMLTGATVGGDVGSFERYRKSISGVFVCDCPRMAAWARESDLWAYGLFMHEYADMKMAVTNIDLAASTMALDNRWYSRGFRRGAPFYVFNAICEIDEPGEWAIDRKNRKIYLKPLLPVESQDPVIGNAMYLLTAKDLSNVEIDGIVFEYSRRDAIRLDNCSDITIRASGMRHTGAWGVTVKGGARVKVAGCDLYDLGEGGVRLEGGDLVSLVPARHLADNNHIAHFGRVIPSYRPGVSLAGVGCEATHNLIHHTPHQGVWFNGNDHRIAYNVIHDTCLFNNDAGAVYCCMRDFTKRGTVIEYNLVHGTGRRPHPTNVFSLYLDDWSAGTIVRGNIFSQATWGVHLGGGQATVVTNNVCVACERWGNLFERRWPASFAKGVIDADTYLYRKLVDNRDRYAGSPWKEKYPHLLAPLSIKDKVVAHDPIYCVLSNNVAMACGELATVPWPETLATCTIGGNVNIPNADDFVDYEDLDFNVKTNSLTWRMLGGNTRFSAMGLYESPDRASPVVKFGMDVRHVKGVRPVPPIEPPAVRIDIKVEKLNDGENAFATGCEGCYLLASQKGKRLVGIGEGIPVRKDGKWSSYEFSFLPVFDADACLALSGGHGAMTEYRNVRVFGAEMTRGVGGLANHNKWQMGGITIKRGRRVKVMFEARADPSYLNR